MKAANEVEIAAEQARRDRGLVRGIGAVGFGAAIVNVVVGAGIFSLPGRMAQAAGPNAWLAYLVCALAIAAVVLCFAESGSRAPTSGGVYGYVEAAFSPMAGFVAAILLWVSCVLACAGIAAAIPEALSRLVPAAGSGLVRSAIIVVVIGGLAAVNLTGAARATRLISLATAIKLVPLVLFVGIGLFFFSPARLHEGQTGDVGGIGRAVLLSLFAFQGAETALGASGEVRDPARTVPRALIAAMAFVAVLYVAIQLVAQGVLGADLAGSAVPLADAMARVDPRLGLVMLGATVVSMTAWIASDLLGAPRVLFALSRDGLLHSALGRVHPKTHVPHVAIAAHAVLAILLALTGTFEQLAVLSVLATTALYMMGCVAAWRLRAQGVALAGPPIRAPLLRTAAVVGTGFGAVLILAARPAEIGGLVAAILGAMLLYGLALAGKRRRAGL